MRNNMQIVAVAVALVSFGTASAEKLVVGVAQTAIENTLDRNLAKVERLIDEAKGRGCRLVVFPENALYWADISTDDAMKADVDAAIGQIAKHADRANLYVVFGASHKSADDGSYRNGGYVLGPDGDMLISCCKTRDVPESFDVHGVRCNLVLCSDRTFLEYSDLPCLVQGSKVIIDISGGHGGDDGRPDMRWIRYRP
ncbi:MAG: carbon-nitrogen hydrolase family protein, partial [Phycisphaerales bacterium]